MRWRHRKHGQASTEFLIVLPMLILLVFGVIQFALIYQARATLNHATLLAARAAALHNGSKSDMRDALATGLVPLFATAPTLQEYAKALINAKKQTAALSNIVSIKVLNPTTNAFKDFARARLDGVAGRELPNDTLNYRNPAPGPSSGISIQDANIVHVRVTYCFRLIVPVVDRVIYSAVNALTSSSPALSANGMSDPFGTHGATKPTTSCFNPLFKGRRIEIQSEAFVRMQSPFYESNL